jgi:MATE family multidrug resistance protein
MSLSQMSYQGHARATMVLGLPLIGGHLGQNAIGVTDTIMLGRYGVEELAAMTAAGSWFFVLFLMGSGFAWAVMPMVASYAAENDEINLRRATRMGLWLSLAFALAAMPLMIWSETILLALGQTEQVARDGAAYLNIAGWGIIPALIVMTFKSYLAALERTQIVLWITRRRWPMGWPITRLSLGIGAHRNWGSRGRRLLHWSRRSFHCSAS